MKALSSFQNLHQNETIVVCGCGESLNDFRDPERFVTIGVNDVGRKFQPDYLVVVNPPNQFSGDRFRYVETSRAAYLFTQLSLSVKHPNVVKFQLGQNGGTDFSNPNVLNYTDNSPYIALCLAVHMGAKRIGVIGVDFTDNHFFARTGKHPLARRFEKINGQYRNLARAARAFGVEIFNLSRTSRLTAFPKISLEEFAGTSQRADADLIRAAKSNALKIVSYATTPVAGVPAILARCIEARTEHTARCVWATNSYGNGVSFAGDVEWRKKPAEAKSLLAEADVVIVHNGKVAREHEKLFKNKAVVTMAHNYLWNVDERFVRRGFPGVVVGQYQAALPEFENWSVVPNPIPFWEADYQPGKKPDRIAICYTPSGKHERYAPEHRLYWHSKGYETTMKVLEKLSGQFSLKLEVIGNRQVSHAESLAMKMRSHIVIDECVTGSYHRNSLEGLASGSVVINGVGLLPKVADVLRFCSGDAEIPFVSARLENLEEVLTGLIESGEEALVQNGKENRAWLEQNWDFARQWESFWMPVIEKSLNKTGRKITVGNLAEKEVTIERKMKKFKQGVSVVIPHGGEQRLPHLRTCLANLRQCADVAEIIVVEMGENPTAAELSRKWADKYVFTYRSDLFERARALNTGSAFAECELVLWLDNDLLVAHDFVTRAVAELRQRNLDFLKPYSEVKYLSLADTEKVMQGVPNPDECRPANVYYSTTTDGGAGLVRRAFLERFGGIPNGFHGWGGEDNGWIHKVHLLGKGERTRSAQSVFHLYHALSGGYGGSAHMEANPHYQANLSLLYEMKATRNSQQFLEKFPPAPHKLWEDTRQICFVAGNETAELACKLAREFSELFGAQIEIVPVKKINKVSEKSPDAVVFFNCADAAAAFSKSKFARFREKTLIYADETCDADEPNLKKCFGILTTDETFAERFDRTIKSWVWKADDAEDFRSLALALAQPLSLLVNAQTAIRESANVVVSKPETSDLPVWLYWEGECPEWIETCQKTILAHLPNARILNPETFNELRDVDREINLSRLHVAHRADFIRAFLLSRYGGVWIDSDCVVLKSLQPLLARLGEYDFAAHRERGGFFGNEFMIARRGSRIAQALYDRICRTLRTRRNFGWCDLGCVPLTDVINKTDAPFLEIDCGLIQPICWRDVEPYVVPGSDSEHRGKLDDNAFCYMLSHLTVNKFLAANPEKNLLDDNSFFSFLVRQSLQNNSANGQNGNGFRRKIPEKTVERKNKNWQEISFYLETISKLSPEKILDVDVGLGRWALLLRDLFESSKNKKDWQMTIDAVIDRKNGTHAALEALYDRVHIGGAEKYLGAVEEKKDLTIFGDHFIDAARAQNEKILERAVDLSKYVLLDLNWNFDKDLSGDEQRLIEFLERRPEQIVIRNYQPETGRATLLISRDDPLQLRPESRMADIFGRSAEMCAQYNEESISGPGSSLEQTAEIRRRLPILFAHLEINSMLDAPCGDFNWLRHVDLRLEKYIGVDVVASIIEQNRSRYENDKRMFRILDITTDFLPRCDLILCRDFLVHMPFAEIFSALRGFRNSGAKYLLTTTFPGTQSNADIETGDWRTLNFQLPPFNFPAPLKIINERCTEGGGKYADKSLGLWDVSEIRGL